LAGLEAMVIIASQYRKLHPAWKHNGDDLEILNLWPDGGLKDEESFLQIFRVIRD
jgi:hypothetical protein